MARGVDVYLFPAVVGGGLGDIEEVLAAGRRLDRAGFRTILFRRPHHPLPPTVGGPWAWPRLERTRRITPRSRVAMTVVPAWGVSAAPERPGPYGRAGPWAAEAADVERAYGAERTLHVSLEEFARTLPRRAENLERLREGGVRARDLSARLLTARSRGEVAAFDRAFLEFRAFDRPNVLHLFATFRPSRRFAREFPAAIQTGPLWPARYRPRPVRRRARSRSWVWYASPASAEAIAPDVVRGLRESGTPVRLFVRSPRRWKTTFDPAVLQVETRPLPDPVWRRRFGAADLRIVTGSRTLLEALEVGGPFLYYNGTLGVGAARRRHRPEKIAALVAASREAGWPADLLRDLADFAAGRRVAAVVHRAAGRERGWDRFPRRLAAVGFPRPFDDAGALLVSVARALAAPGVLAPAVVDQIRRRSNAISGTAAPRR